LIPYGDQKILALQRTLPARVEWVAVCFNRRGQLVNASTTPLETFPRLGDTWDAVKTGAVFRAASQGPVEVYYAGSPAWPPKDQVQLGLAEIDPAALGQKIITANCH
jgi:hypothetical protein